MTSEIGIRIQSLRISKGITQEELSTMSGVHRVSIAKYESGAVKHPSSKTLEAIASALGTSTDYILGRTDQVKANYLSAFPDAYPMPPQNSLPIYGAIKCGPGGLAMEELLGYAQSEKDPATHFMLMCYGDSMLPDFRDGDVVVIHQQEDVESGEIAAVIVDNEEGTLKRVVIQEKALTLVALNPAYPPRTFVGEDMNRVHIIGKVVEMKRTY